MASSIASASQKAIEIARYVCDLGAEASFAFICYRDYGDENQIETFPFVSKEGLPEMAAWIKALEATGGGDGPEDVYGAFAEIIELDWQAPTKIIIHVADAPCHGTKYHSMEDSFPSGDPTGHGPEDLLREFAKLGMDYYFLRLSSATDRMIEIFKESYRAQAAIFRTLDLRSADPAEFLKVVKTSIGVSLSRVPSIAHRVPSYHS